MLSRQEFAARYLEEVLRSRYPRLTPRQLEIAALWHSGLNREAIRDQVGISIRTVEDHVYKAYKKLKICDRHEFVGLVDDLLWDRREESVPVVVRIDPTPAHR